MKSIVVIVLMLLSRWMCAQDIGIGILSVDFSRPFTIDFYANRGDALPVHQVVVIQNRSKDFLLKDEKATLKWFQPEAFWPDYTIFDLRVLEHAGGWYKVVTNTTSRATMWIRERGIYTFHSWPEFLGQQVTTISIGNNPLPIKTSPDDSAKTLRSVSPSDCFEVLEVKGDWLRIRTHTVLECSDHPHPVKIGWIRWRAHNRLQITYGKTC